MIFRRPVVFVGGRWVVRIDIQYLSYDIHMVHSCGHAIIYIFWLASLNRISLATNNLRTQGRRKAGLEQWIYTICNRIYHR